MRKQYILAFVNRTQVYERITSIRAELTAELNVITEELPLTYIDKKTGEEIEVSVLVKDWRTDECLTIQELPPGLCHAIAKTFYYVEISGMHF